MEKVKYELEKTVDHLSDECVAKGYFPVMRREPTRWRCELHCSVYVLGISESRPYGEGSTALDALVAAMEKIVK